MKKTVKYRKNSDISRFQLVFGLKQTNNALWKLLISLGPTFVESLKLKLQYGSVAEVPIEVFQGSLSPLESLVSFLHHKGNLNGKDIAVLLKRSTATISQALSSFPVLARNSQLNIPLSIFLLRKLSIQESLIFYLHNKQKYSLKTIAEILHLAPSTVSTSLQRAKEKLKHSVNPQENNSFILAIDTQKSAEHIFAELSKVLEKKEIFHHLLSDFKIDIPISLFSVEKGYLDALVAYLKNKKILHNSEIAFLLNRSEKTISQSVVRHSSGWISQDYSGPSIPLSILANRKYSLLESIVVYLHRERSLPLKKIAIHLHIHYKTAYAALSSAKQKEAP